MPHRRFLQVDVFSPQPTRGNGLAVVVDADGLDDTAMQRFAAWTQLAETTFLLRPTEAGADYRVRIFTPAREMPFAGHPTLGSCAAWLHAGGRPASAGRVVQQCAIGLVAIDVSNAGEYAFAAPPVTVRPMDPPRREAIVAALGLDPARIVRCAELDNGPVWQAFELDSADAVLAVDATRVRYPEFLGIGLVGPHAAGADCDLEVRMLAPSSGLREDPITGSLNAALAGWRRAEGRLAAAQRVAQGTAIGRLGRVSVRPDGDTIWIGGAVHVLVEGTVRLQRTERA